MGMRGRSGLGMSGSYGIDEVEEAAGVPVRPALILPPWGSCDGFET
jgi:hypothetical protein